MNHTTQLCGRTESGNMEKKSPKKMPKVEVNITGTSVQNGTSESRSTGNARSTSSIKAPASPSTQDSSTDQNLTGRASLSPTNLVFGISLRPVSEHRRLLPDMPIQKALSVPDMSTKGLARSESPNRVIPVDILQVMKRLSVAAHSEEQLDAGSEDSYMAWSDGDSSISNSTASSPVSEAAEKPLLREASSTDKAHRIALELTTTEETYVQRLKILDKARNNTEQILGYDVARQMFPYINSIYTLHNNILPQLKKRLTTWRLNPQIGDIMKTFSPYLKMYADYVKNFDEALKVVETWNAKNEEFSTMLRYLTPKNDGNLDLKLQIKSHMLEPVQRVPRYQLLLKQYCKEIPDDSAERSDLEVALSSVTQAALLFEDMMKHGTLMGELGDLQRIIDCPISLISSTRQLIREGGIGKVHATSGKQVQRYIFLFNDLFLLCSENAWMFAVHKYKARDLMETDGMQVTDCDDPNGSSFTFYVKTRKKTLELSASSQKEKLAWEQVLRQVIEDRVRSKLTSTAAVSQRKTMVLCPDSRLGKEAPTWIHNSNVTMCMVCAADFRAMRRKHHCRACGVVVCNKCSSHNVPLEYDDYIERRVCDECYLVLEKSDPTVTRQGILRVNSPETCLHQGYILMSTDSGYSWHKRWLQHHSGYKLLCFKAQQDVRPVCQIELSECAIDVCVMSATKIRILRIKSTKKSYLVQACHGAAASNDLAQWIETLRTRPAKKSQVS